MIPLYLPTPTSTPKTLGPGHRPEPDILRMLATTACRGRCRSNGRGPLRMGNALKLGARPLAVGPQSSLHPIVLRIKAQQT